MRETTKVSSSGKVITGSRHIIYYQMASQALKIGRMLLFGAYLTPFSLGIFSIVLIFGGLLESFSRTGVVDSLIAKEGQPSREDLDNAWTIDFIRYIVLGIACYLVADVVAVFFVKPEAAGLVRLFSISFFFNAVRNNGVLLLIKNLEMKIYLTYNFLPQAGSFVVMFLALVLGANLKLLVWSLNVQSILLFILSYVYVPRCPSFKLKKELTLRQLSFGQWLFYQNIIEFFGTRFDRFIIVRLVGLSSMGSFTFASSLSTDLSRQLKNMAKTLLMPYFSIVQGNREKVWRSYVSYLSLLLFLAPLAVFVIMNAGPFVSALFGNKWNDASRILPVLLIALTVNVIMETSESLFYGVQRPSSYFRFSVVKVLAVVPLLFVLTYNYQLLGAALAVLLANVISLTFWARLIEDYMKVDKIILFKLFYPAIGLACLQAGITLILARYLPAPASLLLQVVLVAAFLAVSDIFLGMNTGARPTHYYKAIARSFCSRRQEAIR